MKFPILLSLLLSLSLSANYQTVRSFLKECNIAVGKKFLTRKEQAAVFGCYRLFIEEQTIKQRLELAKKIEASLNNKQVKNDTHTKGMFESLLTITLRHKINQALLQNDLLQKTEFAQQTTDLLKQTKLSFCKVIYSTFLKLCLKNKKTVQADIKYVSAQKNMDILLKIQSQRLICFSLLDKFLPLSNFKDSLSAKINFRIRQLALAPQLRPRKPKPAPAPLKTFEQLQAENTEKIDDFEKIPREYGFDINGDSIIINNKFEEGVEEIEGLHFCIIKDVKEQEAAQKELQDIESDIEMMNKIKYKNARTKLAQQQVLEQLKTNKKETLEKIKFLRKAIVNKRECIEKLQPEVAIYGGILLQKNDARLKRKEQLLAIIVLLKRNKKLDQEKEQSYLENARKCAEKIHKVDTEISAVRKEIEQIDEGLRRINKRPLVKLHCLTAVADGKLNPDVLYSRPRPMSE